MKIKEIHEAGEWNDLSRKAAGAIRQGNTAGKSQDNYKMYMDKFQKDLEAVDPEEAKELSELRADYKARPSAAAAQRLSTFILDRAKYVADKENAEKALAGAQDAMAKLKGQAAAPQAHKVGTYSAPKPQSAGSYGDPQVNVANHTYTYDYNLKKWTDENKLPVNDKADEQELHKRWEEINDNPPGGGATPAEIRSAQQKNVQQTIDRATRNAQGQAVANPAAAPAAAPAATPYPQVFRRRKRPAAAPAKPRYRPDGSGGWTQVGENIDFGKMLWDRMKNKR